MLTRSLVGVIASMAVVNLVYGISFPLLALVLDQQGVSRTLIGLNTVVQAAAIFAVAPLAPRWLERLGPARIMQLSALVLAALFLLAGWQRNVWVWFPLRFVIGGLTALLWIASEALINELAPDRIRGRVVALYASVGAAGFAFGPLLLIATGSEGMLPFYATATTILLATLPLFLVVGSHRVAYEETEGGLWRVFWLAPVIMLANVVYAASVESVITFFPIFGTALGVSEEYALGLMTVIAVGGMLLVLPLGWLADRVDRMGMLAVCVALTVLGFAFMPLAVQAPPWAGGLYAFVFGGVEGMIYALGVTLVGERFRGAALAAATTTFTAGWGAGTIIGPLVSGVGMDLLGNTTLAWIAGGFFLLYLPLPLWAWWNGRDARSG